MRFDVEPEPITDDDATIRAALDDVDVAPLLVAVAHLTGSTTCWSSTCVRTRAGCSSPTPASPPSRPPRAVTSSPAPWPGGGTGGAHRHPRSTSPGAAG